MLMYLIQENSLNPRVFNFSINNQSYYTVSAKTDVPYQMVKNVALIGTTSFNYYITDNLTAASLNMQVATLRFSGKLHTFN